MFKHMEFAFVMAELAKIFKPHTYVEIGVQKCFTFNKMSPLVKRAVAVDINPPRGMDMHPHIETFIMPSQEFAKVWKDPIDILFIDADHRKESVLSDTTLLAPFVRETGFILLHDTHPIHAGLLADGYCSNAYEAAWEIYKNWTDWQIFTFPGPWAGLSLLRKVTKPLYWMEYAEPKHDLQSGIFQEETQTELESSGDGGGDTESPQPGKRGGRRVRDRRPG